MSSFSVSYECATGLERLFPLTTEETERVCIRRYLKG